MILQKPRTKGKYKADFILIDGYKDYKKNVIKELQKSQKVWNSIIKTYYKRSVEALLTKKEPIKLTGKLGIIDIRKTKPKLQKINEGKRIKGIIDWSNTRKYGKTIYHLNEHRDGFVYRFCWLNRGTFKNKLLYSFISSRKNSRLLKLILTKYDKSQIDFPEKDK